MAKKTETQNKLDSLFDKMKKDYPLSLPDVMVAGHVNRLLLSSPKLNYIFGGGMPIGRIIELFGPESGGKTILLSHIAGQFQKRTDGKPNTVVIVDMEHTFDIDYAQIAGLDPDPKKLIFLHPQHGEEGFEICQKLIETGEISLIGWDSIAATPSASTLVDEYGHSNFGKTAALFSEGLRKFNPYLSRFGTSLILLNQVRAKIGGFQSYGPQENTPGGYAVKFYASWRGRVSKIQDILDNKVTIGNSIRIKNVKSKIGIPKRSAELELYYDTGFNPDLEYIDFIISLGLVEKSGAWYIYKDEKFQGREALIEMLRNNRDIFDEMKEIVNNSFKNHSPLDDMETEDMQAEAEMIALDKGGE